MLGFRMEDELRLLTIDEVIHLLRISKATLHKLVAKKSLLPTKIGDRTLFTRREIERFIDQQTGMVPTRGKKRGRKPTKGSE
jgi:excisionase family DNA binding protein